MKCSSCTLPTLISSQPPSNHNLSSSSIPIFSPLRSFSLLPLFHFSSFLLSTAHPSSSSSLILPIAVDWQVRWIWKYVLLQSIRDFLILADYLWFRFNHSSLREYHLVSPHTTPHHISSYYIHIHTQLIRVCRPFIHPYLDPFFKAPYCRLNKLPTHTHTPHPHHPPIISSRHVM